MTPQEFAETPIHDFLDSADAAVVRVPSVGQIMIVGMLLELPEDRRVDGLVTYTALELVQVRRTGVFSPAAHATKEVMGGVVEPDDETLELVIGPCPGTMTEAEMRGRWRGLDAAQRGRYRARHRWVGEVLDGRRPEVEGKLWAANYAMAMAIGKQPYSLPWF